MRRFFSLRLRRAALSSEDEDEELLDSIVAGHSCLRPNP